MANFKVDFNLFQDSIIVIDLADEEILLFSKTTGEDEKDFKHPDERYYGVAMFSDQTQPSVTGNLYLSAGIYHVQKFSDSRNVQLKIYQLKKYDKRDT